MVVMASIKSDLSVGLLKLVDAALVKIRLRQCAGLQVVEAGLDQLRLSLRVHVIPARCSCV